MNPGNGIETDTIFSQNNIFFSFLFMNPGNGIETTQEYRQIYNTFKEFLIYESRQRD